MNAHGLPGIGFREAAFAPSFSKGAGERCFGVQMHILDPQEASPVLAGLLLLDGIRDLHPDRFEFLAPAKPGGPCHLDHLLGTDRYRLEGIPAAELLASYAPALDAFLDERRPYLLYPWGLARRVPLSDERGIAGYVETGNPLYGFTVSPESDRLHLSF